MKKLILLALLALSTPAEAQYGYPGPPMWSRRPGDYRVPPPRGGYDLPPCIQYGDCGPRRPPMPPFRYPPRYY